MEDYKNQKNNPDRKMKFLCFGYYFIFYELIKNVCHFINDKPQSLSKKAIMLTINFLKDC